MITMNMMGKIRRMHYLDGLSIKQICRQTGLARNTVRHWLRVGEDTEPKYERKERETVRNRPPTTVLPESGGERNLGG